MGLLPKCDSNQAAFGAADTPKASLDYGDFKTWREQDFQGRTDMEKHLILRLRVRSPTSDREQTVCMLDALSPCWVGTRGILQAPHLPLAGCWRWSQANKLSSAANPPSSLAASSSEIRLVVMSPVSSGHAPMAAALCSRVSETNPLGHAMLFYLWGH